MIQHFLLLFLSLIAFGLAGCSFISNKASTISSISYTGKIYPHKEITVQSEESNAHVYNQSEGFIVPLTGKVSKNTQIGQHISINNTTLTYKGIFSLVLPYIFETWEYSTGLFGLETLSLMNKKNGMSISINNKSFSSQGSDEQTECNTTVGELISSISKVNNKKTFYINTVKYPDSFLLSKEICFIYNDFIYRISFSDNNTFTTRSINSFTFMPQETSEENIQKKTDYLGQHTLLPHITGLYSNMIVSGNTFVYKNFFSIDIPKRLQFRQILRPSMNLVDLYLVDKNFNNFQMDDVSFLNLIITSIASRKEPNELQTCLALQNHYEPNKLEILTGKHITYRMYRNYDSFGYVWKQGDICFFDSYFVYNISVRLPTFDEVKTTINSFTFH